VTLGVIRVGFNARLLHAPDLRGWNRYTVNLLGALVPLGVEPILYTDRPLDPSHLDRLPAQCVTVREAPAMPYVVWEQHWLPRQCGRDHVDLLHSPFNFGLPWSSPCLRILTLHDAIGLDDGAGWWRRWSRGAVQSRFYHWCARTRANRIITDSMHARDELVGRLGLPATRIAVVPLAADPRFHRPVASGDRARIRRRYGLAGPYLFYVGGWEERKNVPCLVRGFAAAALEGVALVLAGGRASEQSAMVSLVQSCGAAEGVRLLGWVEDEDLPALYAEALGFIYPSRHEGFGLQVCEAMAVGCPTLASQATALPEVVGNGGLLFDPDRPDELARLLRRLVADPCFRAGLAQRGRVRSATFSWSRTAQATLAVYQEALSHARRAVVSASAAHC
jgi:glycosyltransferase involved in cell wall biosynthesis